MNDLMKLALECQDDARKLRCMWLGHDRMSIIQKWMPLIQKHFPDIERHRSRELFVTSVFANRLPEVLMNLAIDER